MKFLTKKILKFFYKISDYSQAGQDLFALELFGKNGTYIDVGSGEPKIGNNTYSLEVENNWKGFCVDFDQNNYEKRWKNCPERNNKVYWEDASKFDYNKGLIENNLPNKIDYLSCDLDPQEKTFVALKKVINDGIEPKLITFETDKYREKIDYEKLAINFLYPKNYIIAVKDVYSGLKKKKVFETWFINKNINFNQINYEKWVKKL
jgi:hypothetical protein|tara:strand:+ start:72 stop:689 length:618 start_codon:yes stop_codon:yes gene_type:complete